MSARIELRTRDLSSSFGIPGIGIPQHGFFLEIAENGAPIHILRAGPRVDGFIGALHSDLVVDYVQYNAYMTGRAATDYVADPSKYRAVTIFTGTREEVREKFNKLWEVGKGINDGKFDYKFPICDIVFAPIICKVCDQQNSNAFLTKAMEHAGIPVKYPTDADGTPVWLPGAKSDIRDTLVDHIIGYGVRYADISLDKAVEIFKDVDFHNQPHVPAMIGQYYDEFVRNYKPRSVRESIKALRASEEKAAIEAQQKAEAMKQAPHIEAPVIHSSAPVSPVLVPAQASAVHIDHAPYISHEAMQAAHAAAQAAASFHNNAANHFQPPIPHHHGGFDGGVVINVVVPQQVQVPQQDFTSNIKVFEAINVPLGYDGPLNFHFH